MNRTLVLAVALVALAGALPAQAQTCPGLTLLSPGVPQTATTDPAYYTENPLSKHWSVTAVRANDNAVWTLGNYDNTAVPPGCLAGHLDDADLGFVTFLATDWHARALKTDISLVRTVSATGTSAAVGFDLATFPLEANRPFLPVTFTAGTPASVQETQLFGGVPYRIRIIPALASIGARFFLFEPVTFGNGYVRRSEAFLNQVLNPGLENDIDFVAPFDGVYGIVITNESGADGGFSISVAHCPFSFNTLADNVPLFTVLNDDWLDIDPTSPTWGVVGERGQAGFTYGIDVAPGLSSQNGTLYACSDSVLAAQPAGAGVRLIAGDFRSLAKRLYSVHLHFDQQPDPVSLGNVEWEDGADLLAVNAPPTAVSPPANNVLDAWSVSLVAGTPYQFHLARDPGTTAAYRMMLFANPAPGGAYWATRPDAVWSDTTFHAFTPSATGLYGLVVANDNGGTGHYTISVTGPGVDVPPLAPSPAAGAHIVSARPNPTLAGLRVAYTLGRPGQVGLTIVDLLGRTVARVAPRAGAAGEGELVWDGRASGGARVAAGVYFAVLRVDAHDADRTRVVVLD